MTGNPFDWDMFWLFTLISIPGLILGIMGFIRTYWHYIKTHYPVYKKVNVITGFIILNLILIPVAIALGIQLSATVNARNIFFMALINEKNIFRAFLFEFLGALIVGFPAALIYLSYYYYGFRKTLSEKSLYIFEKMRNHSGLGSRVLYNSVVGEVVFRWGLQSLFVYVIMSFQVTGAQAIITAIIVSSIIYAYLHMFNLRFIKISGHASIRTHTFILNFFSSVIFGFIFWKFGIFASMVAHSLLHILWYPLDIFYYRKFPDD